MPSCFLREDRYFQTKPELLDKIVGLLGGRVAEEIIFGEVSTGATMTSSALQALPDEWLPNSVCLKSSVHFNSDNHKAGKYSLGRDFNNDQNYSDAIAYEIDQEIQRFIKECYERAKTILTENHDKLELIAQTLLEVETLDAEQIKLCLSTGKLPDRTYSDDQEKTDDVKVNINKRDDEEKNEDEKE